VDGWTVFAGNGDGPAWTAPLLRSAPGGPGTEMGMEMGGETGGEPEGGVFGGSERIRERMFCGYNIEGPG